MSDTILDAPEPVRKTRTPKPKPEPEMRSAQRASDGRTFFFMMGLIVPEVFLKHAPPALAGKNVRVENDCWRLVRGKIYPATKGKQGAFEVTYANVL